MIHRLSTQAKARLRSSNFRLQRLLNFSCVLKIGASFVERGLSFGNRRAIDCLAGGEAVRKNFGLDRRDLLQDGLGFDQRLASCPMVLTSALSGIFQCLDPVASLLQCSDFFSERVSPCCGLLIGCSWRS
jgi:hypothetical protein